MVICVADGGPARAAASLCAVGSCSVADVNIEKLKEKLTMLYKINIEVENMAKKEKVTRFVKTHSDGVFGSMEIWVDKKTGVNYLYRSTGYSGGLTVLVDADGRPIVTPVSELPEE